MANILDKNKLMGKILIEIQNVILAVIIAVLILQFAQVAKVNGNSMAPNYEDGQRIVVSRFLYIRLAEKQRGDVVVIKENESHRTLVKRIIGVEGETITIKDSKVYINGDELSESYLDSVPTYGDMEVVIPKGSYFVMGDNRINSLDSRDPSVGLITNKDIYGKHLFQKEVSYE